MTKKEFKEATKLINIWNKIINFKGLTLATVMWHSGREWKVIKKGENFDTISDRKYEPIAEFHTQEELWKYLTK